MDILSSILGAVLFGVFCFYALRYLKRYLDSSEKENLEFLKYKRSMALSLEKIASNLDDLSKKGISPKNKED